MLLEAAIVTMWTYIGAFHLPPLLRRARLEIQIKKDPQGALPKIRKELERNGPTGHRDVVLFLLAECLYLLGDFPGAVEAARSVDAQTFQRSAVGPMFGHLARLLYVNNMVYYLTVGGDLQAASSLVDELHRLSGRYAVGNFLGAACRDTLATYYYHTGQRAEARRLFEECLGASSKTSFVQGLSRYYLGRLDLVEGRTEQGLAKIAESAKQLQGTFFADEPRRLANGTELIPPPP